jgi:hypothetical protein
MIIGETEINIVLDRIILYIYKVIQDDSGIRKNGYSYLAYVVLL